LGGSREFSKGDPWERGLKGVLGAILYGGFTFSGSETSGVP